MDAIISELNKLVDNITVDHSGQPGWGKGAGPVKEENENGTKEVVELMLNAWGRERRRKIRRETRRKRLKGVLQLWGKPFGQKL